MAINYELERAIQATKNPQVRDFLRAQKTIFNAAEAAGIVTDLPRENVTSVIVDQTSTIHERSRRTKREPDVFLQNVARNGKSVLENGSDETDFGFFKFQALKSLGFDIRFEEGAHTPRGQTLPNRIRALTDTPDTKKKILAIEKFMYQNPLLKNIHNIRQPVPDEEVLTRYVQGITQILNENPELKP